MTWERRGLIQVWTGETEPGTTDEAAYRYCAVPVGERPRPTCGRPGSGRSAHRRHGEPTCQLCARAEAA